MTALVAELYDKFVTPEPNSGCWLWTGANHPFGYGVYRRNHRNGLAHRLFYTALRGEIGAKRELDHLCRVPSCVNPAHLESVTHAENIRRGWLAKRPDFCRAGHPWSGDNTLILSTTGHRACRSCARARIERWKARQATKEIN